MPKINEQTTVEDGSVMGYVRTHVHGSTCTFEICSIEEWEEMTEKEAEEAALQAMFESGEMEWWY